MCQYVIHSRHLWWVIVIYSQPVQMSSISIQEKKCNLYGQRCQLHRNNAPTMFKKLTDKIKQFKDNKSNLTNYFLSRSSYSINELTEFDSYSIIFLKNILWHMPKFNYCYKVL